MASSTTLSWKYDVFLSFRGADTCNAFATHLFDVLCRNRIVTSKNENLDGGEDLSPATVEQSRVSVVILSVNYASSPRCLDELVKIVNRKKANGQTVVPIFYKVDPVDIQQLKGKFGDAFAHHEIEFKNNLIKVEAWSQALKEIAELPGFVSWNIRHETGLIEEIVNRILDSLSHAFPSCTYDGLVGIASRVQDIESLLDMESQDVLFLGIWGMSGIGKSTLARRVFDQFSSLFEGRCCIANVREKLETYTLEHLQREIISKLCGKRTSHFGVPIGVSSSIRQLTRRKKILIVLDDVTNLKQIEYLIGDCRIYGSGSRIIVTSRDRQLLINGGAKIYEVKRLMFHEAMNLFSLHAFKQNSPPEVNVKLATKAINYAQGIPLALKVLGSNLYEKSMRKWEDELEKLEAISDKNIENILRISYDELDDDEKEIFLDLACFFKSEDRELVERILNSNGFFARIGIGRLLDKSLITISDNELGMHDLLRQMGRDIVCKECMKEPGRRSRLWIAQDIFHLLTKDEVTTSVEGISLDILKIGHIELSSTAFMRMHKLRFLKVYNPYYYTTENYRPSCGEIKVKLSRGLEFLPDKIKFLYWYQYPLKYLPSSFCPKNLVELRLIHSHIEQLFDGHQYLENMKFMDLSYSMKLIAIPDLSRIPKLEILTLKGCIRLVEIYSSKQYESNLTDVNLGYCKSLCRFSSFLQFRKLNYLSLQGCSKITEFPNIPMTIKCLVLNETAAQQVPLSIGNCCGLTVLELKSCTMVESLPTSIGELRGLEKLDLEGCSRMMNLPDSICNLQSLQSLAINKCRNLKELPENLGDLGSLKRFYAEESGIRQLPSSVNQLTKLTWLDCNGCKGLILPHFTDGLSGLKIFYLRNCGISKLNDSFGSLVSLTRLYLSGNDIETVPEGVKKLHKLHTLELRDCKKLKYLSDLPSALKNLFVRNCIALESISFIQGNIDSLMSFDAANCTILDQSTSSMIFDYVLLSHEPRLDQGRNCELLLEGDSI
ncbi:disease resistance protein RPV1-like isoform X2 [Euphorbia lathyris]|uniref:disease resistance protein RPV1-like isoform X2 n=1 Tax=Euphorbia lathyris TaxID=212925 RepID=UPI003313EE70